MKSDNFAGLCLINIKMQQKHNFYMKSEVKWESKYLKKKSIQNQYFLFLQLQNLEFLG